MDIEEIGGLVNPSENPQMVEKSSVSSGNFCSSVDMEDSHVTVSSGCSPAAKIPKIEEISDKPAQRSEESPKKDRVEMKLLNQKNETHDHEEPSSSSSQTVPIPPLPSNSFQLEADLRKLEKNHPGTMYKYLKQIKPDMYLKIFHNSLEPEILNQLLQVFQSFYIK
ncbi:RNA polymerase II-associated protein 3-like [Arapaima gigas]